MPTCGRVGALGSVWCGLSWSPPCGGTLAVLRVLEVAAPVFAVDASVHSFPQGSACRRSSSRDRSECSGNLDEGWNWRVKDIPAAVERGEDSRHSGRPTWGLTRPDSAGTEVAAPPQASGLGYSDAGAGKLGRDQRRSGSAEDRRRAMLAIVLEKIVEEPGRLMPLGRALFARIAGIARTDLDTPPTGKTHDPRVDSEAQQPLGVRGPIGIVRAGNTTAERERAQRTPRHRQASGSVARPTRAPFGCRSGERRVRQLGECAGVVPGMSWMNIGEGVHGGYAGRGRSCLTAAGAMETA